MNEKQLREQQGRIETQMEAMIGKLDAEHRTGFNAEEKVTWDRLCDEHSKIEDQRKGVAKEQESIEAARKKIAAGKLINNPGGISDFSIDGVDLNQFRMKPKAVIARNKRFEASAYERAFHNYLSRPMHFQGEMEGLESGDVEILTRFKNAQSSIVGSQGGVLIPQGFSDILTEAMLWFGGIDGVVGEFDTSTGNILPWPTVNDTTNKGRIIGQNVQSVETDFVFTSVTFNAYIGSSDIVLMPIALMEDSYFDMDGLAARLLGTRLGRLLNWKGTTGTGTAEPTGIVTAAVAAGNVLTLGAGNTASIAYGNLVDLEHSVDPSYRYNPSSYFMFGDTMLKLLKKLVDGNNRPLWQPGLTASIREGAGIQDLSASRPTILDHPYIINQDMAVPAASAYSMLFGDLANFKMRRVAGGITLQRLVERYADYLQVGFQAFMRFDCNLVDAGTHPIGVLQQSAS